MPAATTDNNSPLHLSPSLVHQRLIPKAPRKLAFSADVVFSTWKQKVRRKIRQLIRLPKPEPTPLNPRLIWKRQTDLGTIEKVIFTAEPGADIPAYWCVPQNARPPYTAFICMQGHNTGMHNSIGVAQDDEITPIEAPGDRDFALECMRRGIAALAVEVRSFGERRERAQKSICSYNTCQDQAVHALMLGRTAIGERVFDVDRAIDYLIQRGDVHPQRIGCMGQSGGGSVTMYAAATLNRLAFAMPSCCVCDYGPSILSLYHCTCNHIPDACQWIDVADVLGAFAPKPLVVVAGKQDDIFPIDGVRSAVRQIRAAYRSAGAEEKIQFVEGAGGHDFYAAQAWPKMLQMIP